MSSLAPLLTITPPKQSSSSIAQPRWQGIFKRLTSLFSAEAVSLKKHHQDLELIRITRSL